MARRALLILISLLAAGCSTSDLAPRPVARGFGADSGVLAPYDDGKRHLAAGRYGLAIERFGQVLAGDRRSLEALNGLAIAYVRLGRFDIGQGYFERALEIDAFSVPTLNNYGRALIEQGRLRDAGPFLQLALQRAAEPDLAVIAANVESIRASRSPALVAAVREPPAPPVRDSRRLIRLAAHRYRLETPGEPPARPEPTVVALEPSARAVPLPRLRPAEVTALARLVPLPQLRPADLVMARQPYGEAGAPSALVLAGGADGLGIALASAADLEALGLDPETLAARSQLALQHAELATGPAGESQAAAPSLADGEPT